VYVAIDLRKIKILVTMSIHEMSQEEMSYGEGGQENKIVYVIGEDGNYIPIPVNGQQAKHISQMAQWGSNTLLHEIETKVKAGMLSPIAYYMEKNEMDIATLAQKVGKWEWQVKKHLQPHVFSKLSPALIQLYANIFNITFATLVHFGDEQQ